MLPVQRRFIAWAPTQVIGLPGLHRNMSDSNVGLSALGTAFKTSAHREQVSSFRLEKATPAVTFSRKWLQNPGKNALGRGLPLRFPTSTRLFHRSFDPAEPTDNRNTRSDPHRHKPFFLPPSEPGGQSSRSRRGVHGERHVSTAATAANPPVALPSLDAQSGPEGGKKGPPAWTVWLDSARAGRSFSDLLPSEGTCHSISPPLSRIETAAVLPDRSSAVTSKIESPSRHQKMLSKGRGLSEIPA